MPTRRAARPRSRGIVPPIEAERNALMLQLHDGPERLSFAQLAGRFGVTRARAHQIVTRERARGIR